MLHALSLAAGGDAGELGGLLLVALTIAGARHVTLTWSARRLQRLDRRFARRHAVDARWYSDNFGGL